MKYVLKISLIFQLIFLIACTGTKNIKKYEEPTLEYKVVEVPIISGSDTIISNELRFYKIKSAIDAMQLMYTNFGDWNLKLDGRYQENVPQLVWKKVNLPVGNESYTVSASGTETRTAYFASIVVLDAQNRDCLKKGHPAYEDVINYFQNNMKALKGRQKFLSKYRH